MGTTNLREAAYPRGKIFLIVSVILNILLCAFSTSGAANCTLLATDQTGSSITTRRDRLEERMDLYSFIETIKKEQSLNIATLNNRGFTFSLKDKQPENIRFTVYVSPNIFLSNGVILENPIFTTQGSGKDMRSTLQFNFIGNPIAYQEMEQYLTAGISKHAITRDVQNGNYKTRVSFGRITITGIYELESLEHGHLVQILLQSKSNN